jgi:HupE / UreJ protein
MRLLRAALSLFICLTGLMGAGSVHAHPLTTRNVRVIHLDAAGADAVAYIRLTLPLLVGNGVAPPSAGVPVPAAPFTLSRWESGLPFWYADIDAIRSNARELGRLVVEGHTVAVDGATIPGRLLSVAVHPRGHVPPFDTVAQAATAVAPVPWPDEVTEIDSGYVIVDTAVAYTVPRNIRRLTVSSRLAPGALGEVATVNLLVDHRDRDAVYYRATGLLTEPLVIAPGPLEGAGSFVRGGIDHILSGMDHVLFVACLVMGAAGVGALASRITGFTIGHSVTLAAGFFGFAPRMAWFEPGVEAAIAASILVAGASSLLGRGGRSLILVTTAIGLVHGFGLSFSLRDLLAIDGPNILPGLAAFNVGVEIGQLAIGLSVFLLFRALRPFGRTDRSLRFATVTACVATAVVWLVDRVPAVWHAALNS